MQINQPRRPLRKSSRRNALIYGLFSDLWRLPYLAANAASIADCSKTSERIDV